MKTIQGPAMQIGYTQTVPPTSFRDDRVQMHRMVHNRGHKARVENQEVGFRVGGFGVRYSSSKTTLDTDSLHREMEAYRARAASRAFAQELEVALERLDCTQDRPGAAQFHVSSARGLAAYQSQLEGKDPPSPGGFRACI
ncbi:MAG: hypothetical protein ACLFNV_11330 [Desulfovibrionales bacterium]